MRIIRVFPSKTNATPSDDLAYYNVPDMFVPDADEIHISISFTWDCNWAEYLAEQWRHIAPVKIGGPGYSNDPSGEFIPGKYLRTGYTITSRGCPNHCKHCNVWKREPKLIELPIMDGYIVQDDNLLACSDQHIISVFEMLQRQPQRSILRGLEAKLLKPWHIDWFLKLRIDALWFAYDECADLEPLIHAGKMLKEAGFNHNKLYCYVLIGYKNDTFDNAERRLYQAWQNGFMPFAMLWRGKSGYRDPDWIKFGWPWCRPAAARSICMKLDKNVG